MSWLFRHLLAGALLVTASSTSVPCPATAQTNPGQWVIESEPLVSIGVADGEEAYVLPNVIHGTVLSDGTIVLALYLRGFFELRYFDAQGKHLASVGRFGDGPFEVGGYGLSEMARVPGDSVLVMGRDGRYHLFGPRAEPVWSRRIALPGLHISAALAGPDWVVMAFARETPPVPSGLTVPEVFLTAVHLPTRTFDTLTTEEGEARVFAEGLAFEIPFGALPQFTTEQGGTVWFGHTSRPQIHWRNLSSGQTGVLSPGESGHQVTRSDREQYMRFALEFRDGQDRARVARHHRTMAFPQHFPRYSRLKSDEDGNLWVQDYEPRWSTAAYHWRVFSSDGQLRAEVSAPFNLLSPCTRTFPFGGCPYSLLEIGHEYALILHRDELGVQRVGLHAIRKSGGKVVPDPAY